MFVVAYPLRTLLVTLFLRQAGGLPSLHVTLGEPPAGLDKLDDVQDLLDGHDGETNTRDDPRPERVHLVGAGQLEGGGAVRVREELAERRAIKLGSLLDGGGLALAHGAEEVGREQGGGEGEEVQADEEDLVEGAASE